MNAQDLINMLRLATPEQLREVRRILFDTGSDDQAQHAPWQPFSPWHPPQWLPPTLPEVPFRVTCETVTSTVTPGQTWTF